MKTVATRIKRFVFLGIIVVAASGCLSTSPRPVYYTLDMKPSGNVKKNQYNLRVGHFKLTEPLERQNILIKINNTRADYYAKDQWLSSLGEQVSQKLTSEFGKLEDGHETIIVSGKVISFEQIEKTGGVTGGHVKLFVSFCKDGKDQNGLYEKPLLKKRYEEFVVVKGTGANAAVKALSMGLERIAGKISNDAGKL